MKKNILILTIILVLFAFFSSAAFAEPEISLFGNAIEINDDNSTDGYVTSIQLLLVFTVLTLAPSILIMMTSFTRIVIVLSFIRNALGTQQIPPNQVLIGLALFLTFFIMEPVALEINKDAIQPYLNGTMTQEEALENGIEPIREFMFKQTKEKDLALFLNIAQINDVTELEDVPTRVLIPSFIISELKTAFQIGFVIFIPFLIIDMVVSSILMSMGMMMLPPVMISLPFKILLFVLVDGWGLIIGQLISSFK